MWVRANALNNILLCLHECLYSTTFWKGMCFDMEDEKRLEGLVGYREKLCVIWNAVYFAKSLLWNSWSVDRRLGHMDSIFVEKLLYVFWHIAFKILKVSLWRSFANWKFEIIMYVLYIIWSNYICLVRWWFLLTERCSHEKCFVNDAVLLLPLNALKMPPTLCVNLSCFKMISLGVDWVGLVIFISLSLL